MLHADRWAAAFIGASGNNASAALARVKDLAAGLKPAAHILFGRAAAKRLETLLRESVIETAREESGEDKIALEYSIRFICLLVEKNIFRTADVIIAHVEKRLDKQNGVLEVIAETAASVDSEFENDLGKMICARTGAARIKLQTRVVPELLAGYRLRVGGLYVDASLKGQMEQMAAALSAV